MPEVHLVERHGTDGLVHVSLPEDWSLLESGRAGAPLIAAEPDRGSDVRANVVVTRDDVSAMTFEQWQLGTDEALPRTLAEYQLLDLERLTVDGHPAVRRLAHHTLEGSVAATVDQWAVLVGTDGYTVTFTLPTTRYAPMAAGLDAIGATIRFGTQTKEPQ